MVKNNFHVLRKKLEIIEYENYKKCKRKKNLTKTAKERHTYVFNFGENINN